MTTFIPEYNCKMRNLSNIQVQRNRKTLFSHLAISALPTNLSRRPSLDTHTHAHVGRHACDSMFNTNIVFIYKVDPKFLKTFFLTQKVGHD